MKDINKTAMVVGALGVLFWAVITVAFRPLDDPPGTAEGGFFNSTGFEEVWLDDVNVGPGTPLDATIHGTCDVLRVQDTIIPKALFERIEGPCRLSWYAAGSSTGGRIYAQFLYARDTPSGQWQSGGLPEQILRLSVHPVEINGHVLPNYEALLVDIDGVVEFTFTYLRASHEHTRGMGEDWPLVRASPVRLWRGGLGLEWEYSSEGSDGGDR